jgi:hypothetical protein
MHKEKIHKNKKRQFISLTLFKNDGHDDNNNNYINMNQRYN